VDRVPRLHSHAMMMFALGEADRCSPRAGMPMKPSNGTRGAIGGNVPAKYPVKSLAKALHLLDTVGKHQSGTSIAVLSKELKMGKSTVHRLLATLREFDLVWFDANTSNYALGARILRWSDLLVKQNLLVRHGMPILRDLVNVCHETSNLAVLEGHDILYVAQFESMARLRMSEAIGNRVPAHATSLGKALLATLPDDEFDELYKKVDTLEGITAHTITDKQRLKEHLQKVRQDGVAYDFEENEVGVVCMGAVVKNHTHHAVAAMSISLPIQRLRGENLITFKDHLLKAAARLSAELGHESRLPGHGLQRETRDTAEVAR
jgi:IclR family transcriptional regulator, KDG regulon repressor